MLDFEKLESRPLSRIYFEEGFVCGYCGQWEPVFITTQSLRDAMRKLDRMSPSHRSFYFHLLKTLRKANEIQRRGEEYVALSIPHMAVPG